MSEFSVSGSVPYLPWLASLLQDNSLDDAAQRLEAINPTQSYIVQAPAGSGKTSLLTQRYLALLALSDAPEEIVAMTFTQKAAAEMRERIIEALKLGELPQPDPSNIYAYNTWHLAQAALAQDARQEWFLLQNPQRLRIRTLDSLNAYLVQQMPLLSRLGSQATVTDSPLPLYEQAAARALQSSYAQDAIASLFNLVNGHFKRAQMLLVSMLQKRDQWMPLFSGLQTDQLEKHEFDEALARLVSALFSEKLAQLAPIIPQLENALQCLTSVSEFTKPEWKPFSDWAFSALTQNKNPPGLVDFENWRLLRQALVTKSGTFKKRLTKNDGFPTGTDEEKTLKRQMTECLDELRSLDADGKKVQVLVELADLPLPHYSDAQWTQVMHLMQLLNLAAANLKVVFSEHSQTDFIEIAQAASQALGSDDNPTELALRLDYQLKHLLVDEFQDTSISQYDLLKKLVAGWQAGDGHTLFMVGDPMQSIYRFREAEVGNFLDAWENGVGPVRLRPLPLTVNFRSKAAIISWVNETFAQVLPSENRIEKGAVKYTPSVANQADAEGGVSCHWSLDATMEQEALAIVDMIEHQLSEISHEQTIGVLGRSRGHLMPIALKLKAAGIPFRAVELENLSERQEVQDALALARALLHLGDRPAWLALLRSPVFGLSLDECYQVMGDANTFREPVWTLLKTRVASWPESRQQTLSPLMDALDKGLASNGDYSFSQRVYETWLALGMGFALADEAAMDNVQAFFESLKVLEARESFLQMNRLNEAVSTLFASTEASSEGGCVELMTMHKSKGLEFDTVILPGLGRKPRPNEKSLLNWLSFLHHGREHLVMAPLDQRGLETSALVKLIQTIDAEKEAYELGRLLYVAVTRAKRCLHLFGSVIVKTNDRKLNDNQAKDNQSSDVVKELSDPPKGSLLSSLWSTERAVFETLLTQIADVENIETSSEEIVPKVARLPEQRPLWVEARGTNYLAPELLSALNGSSNVLSSSVPEATNSAIVSAKTASSFTENNALFVTSIGNLVHAVLEQCVTEEVALDHVWLAQRRPALRYWLQMAGLHDETLALALQRVEDSLKNTFAHKKALWSLSSKHTESAVELALTSKGLGFGEEASPTCENALSDLPLFQDLDAPMPEKEAVDYVAAHHIVDRTFIAEGFRWIIDYKTSFFDTKAKHSPQEKEAFIEQQVTAYRSQLARYGHLFKQRESLPQKQVLFFTALGEWVEWEC